MLANAARVTLLNSMNLTELLSVLDIAFIILPLCSVIDLLRLRLTCQKNFETLEWFISHHFNIDKEVAKYFKDPTGFRALQAATKTLISGSTALQAFTQTHWNNSDLDLYVFKQHASTVCRWMEREGYVQLAVEAKRRHWQTALENMDTSTRHPYATSVLLVLTFIQKTEQQRRTVQVIVGAHSPLACVLSFHSSECHE